MTMLSPLGRVPRQRPAAPRRSRRPVPALILLVVLSLITAVVWWQVLHHSGDPAGAVTDCRPTPTLAALALDPHKVQVRVYNASGRSGLARGVATTLHKRGFAISATSNDPLIGVRTVQGVGELRYGSAGSGQAVLVSLQFPGMRLLADPRTDSAVDVALGPTFKAVATPAQVSAAKKKAQAQARSHPSGSNACRSG
jgi:hypothetical protein